MKTEFTDISDTQKSLTIEIPSDVVDQEIERAVDRDLHARREWNSRSIARASARRPASAHAPGSRAPSRRANAMDREHGPLRRRAVVRGRGTNQQDLSHEQGRGDHHDQHQPTYQGDPGQGA